MVTSAGTLTTGSAVSLTTTGAEQLAVSAESLTVSVAVQSVAQLTGKLSVGVALAGSSRSAPAQSVVHS